MSYDLLVFDPEVAPRKRSAFLAWYQEVTEWQGPRDHNSPVGLTGNLRDFYDVFREEFPPINGPDVPVFQEDAPQDQQPFWRRLFGAGQSVDQVSYDDPILTDYSFADSAIYLGFRSKMARMAKSRVVSVAMETGVGFFDASATRGVILHDDDQFRKFMVPRA